MAARIHKEIIMQEGNIPDMCQMFYDLFPEHRAEIRLYGDATGGRRTGQTGKSDYWTIMNEMKSYGAPVRLLVPEDNPKVPDRVNAVNRICRDEDGNKRLEIDPGCKELISDMENVLRDQRGGILKVRNKRDPYFHRTHTSDALGYGVAYEDPVRPVTDTRSSGIAGRLSSPGYRFGAKG